MENIPAIISAISVIIAVRFTYSRYAKNKLTGLKAERMRRDSEAKRRRRSGNPALARGELREVSHKLKAGRAYIVQPHPLGNESMAGICFESKRKERKA